MERKEFRGATEADRIQLAILAELIEIKKILNPIQEEETVITLEPGSIVEVPQKKRTRIKKEVK